MIRKLAFLLAFISLSIHSAFCQKGILRVTAEEYHTKETIAFVNISLVNSSSKIIKSVTTDFSGISVINDIDPGIYSLKANVIGFSTVELKNITIKADSLHALVIRMQAGTDLKAVEIVEYEEPLLNPNTISGGTITREEFESLPSKNTNTVTGQTAGVYTAIDGIRVRESRDKLKKGESYVINKDIVWNQNREDYHKPEEQGFKNTNGNPLSTFSIDVDAASYSNMRRFINQGQLPPLEAVRIEEMINYFDYNYPSPDGNVPFGIHTEYAQCPWNSTHGLLMIGIQGKKVETKNLPPSNLVFLIDVSGSMNSADKLPLLKSSFKMLVAQMRPQDKVAIVVYAGAAGVVLEPTTGKNKEKILAALDKLQAGGSTAGAQGIELAYKLAKENFDSEANNRVILATDGDFNVGVSGDAELVKIIEEKRKQGVYLTVLGFGQGNYMDAKMEGLADKGNGNYGYIDNIMEARKMLISQMGGTLNTIAKDVKIQIEFNPVHVKGYRLIGYENRMLANEDFNDDTKDAGELGSGHTVTALYEIIPASANETVPGIDPLKYQQVQPQDVNANELASLKLRYKNPGVNDTVSHLVSTVVSPNRYLPEQLSENFRFASSVSELGLLLTQSKYASSASYQALILRARKARSYDPDGYKAEFIKLAEASEMLAKK